MNMKLWMEELRRPGYKLPLPLLSYPCISLLHITVRELLCDPQLISKGMQAVAQRHKAAAAVSMMDLSVEAEAFGAGIHFTDNEVPTVTGPVVTSADEADSLVVPAVGTARTGLNLTAVEKAVQLITDRPVFAGIIGPFSLAGRLLEVNEAMVKCYEEPRSVHTVLKKATAFLIAYAGAFKAAGANGIVLAEPLSGLLSPAFTEEFSEPYVRAIVEAVQDDSFAVIYHNCGNNTPLQVESLLRIGADAYHFGNAVSLPQLLKKMPAGTVVMGNIDPVSRFANGTPEGMAAETRRLLGECRAYPGFVLSSGCDIPPQSPWENIDAFFHAAEDCCLPSPATGSCMTRTK